MAAGASDKKFQAASVVTAGITVLIVFGSWQDWWPGTATQGLLVAAELGAVLALGIAWLRHREPGTAREPVVLAGALLAAVSPVIPMVAALRPSWFGLDSGPKEDNVKALAAFVEAAGTIAVAWFVRSFVTPGTTPVSPQTGVGAGAGAAGAGAAGPAGGAGAGAT